MTMYDYDYYSLTWGQTSGVEKCISAREKSCLVNLEPTHNCLLKCILKMFYRALCSMSSPGVTKDTMLNDLSMKSRSALFVVPSPQNGRRFPQIRSSKHLIRAPAGASDAIFNQRRPQDKGRRP